MQTRPRLTRMCPFGLSVTHRGGCLVKQDAYVPSVGRAAPTSHEMLPLGEPNQRAIALDSEAQSTAERAAAQSTSVHRTAMNGSYPSGEPAKHDAEQGMTHGCLSECASREEPLDSRLSARGVEAIDQVAGWEQREMLKEGKLERELRPITRHAPSDLVKREAEDRTVQSMDRKPERSPSRALCERLPEHGDVRVVVPENPPVEWLERAPDERRDRAGPYCPQPRMHTLATVCLKATPFTAPRATSRCSSVRRSMWRRRIHERVSPASPIASTAASC